MRRCVSLRAWVSAHVRSDPLCRTCVFFCSLWQITNTLKPYVGALVAGMPPKCKLPLYEYGVKGVLGFYQAQLTPVVTYRDLQTDVFQCFKEIGNTVLFCLQLEKALVSSSSSPPHPLCLFTTTPELP